MTERTLLASVVLFRELYDSDKDVYDVIAEFIKAAMVFAKKWTIDTTGASVLLTQEFGLSIPDAVVGTTLRKRLHKRDQLLAYSEGLYTLDKNKIDTSQTFAQDLQQLQSNQNELLQSLFSHIEKVDGTLSEEQLKVLVDCFCSYLFDDNSTTKFSEQISSFIIQKQKETGFTDQLNAVREGFVLYDGVRHTPDLNEIGSWKDNLTVYLDTEHLFNAVGYNGTLHRQLFKDFHSLAGEVRHKGNRIIALRYFEECKEEIDRFFYVAEMIIDGKVSLDPSKPAMAAILDDCSTRSDIVAKKARFFSMLSELRVTEAEVPASATDTKYNVESDQLLEQVRKEVESKGRGFNEEKCVNTLRMFTKINGLRRGKSTGIFEKVGHILVSGSSLAGHLAFHPSVKPENQEIPFATDLEFITNRLWFKLHKGLTKTLSRPQSLNVLAKAQVVLSSQINNSVSEKFDQIQADFTDGRISKSDAQYLHNELRTKASAPEALTADSISDAMDFLNHEGYQNHLREKSLLTEKAKRGESAVAELADIKAEQQLQRRKRATLKSILLHAAGALLLVMLIVLAYFSCYLLLSSFANGEDSTLTILGIMVSFIIGTAPFFKVKKIWSWFRNSHAETIQSELDECA